MFLHSIIASIFRPKKEVIEHIDKVEKKTIELKCEIQSVKKRLDPLKQLILEMEKEFKKSADK
jgi:hypothetical protein